MILRAPLARGITQALARFLVSVALAGCTFSAFAEERIIFSRLNFGADRAFLKAIAERYARDGASEDLTLKNIAVARFDLDGDGIPELFVLVEHFDFCGSAGCPIDIYKRDRANKWMPFASAQGTFFDDSDPKHPYEYLIATDEIILGHRTFMAQETMKRWTWDPKTREYYYGTICLSQQCKHELGQE